MTRSNAAPRVSVLIPTYNYAQFLREALDSVLEQEFADFELIISDDASTDDSAAIIAEYVAKDSRVRGYVQPTNLGMVQNWNWCLEQARGEYVKFVFGDDYLTSPQALGRFVALLDAAPGATLAASSRLLVDDHSDPICVCNDLLGDGRFHGFEMISRTMREDRNLIGEPSAVLFRRSAAARGFDPTLRQVVDQEFWYHLLVQGDLVYCAEPLCVFRRHAGQQTAANRAIHLGPMESLLILARYLECVSNPANGGFSGRERRTLLFRRLYYSRKHAPRSAGILRAEALIGAQLSRRDYAVAWCSHRLTKPWSNLARYFRHRVLGRQRHSFDTVSAPPRQVSAGAAATAAGTGADRALALPCLTDRPRPATRAGAF